MEIVKKNILSIIFGVIALIALIAWFWPLGSIQSAAEADLQKRVGVARSMEQISKQDRQLPVVSLEEGGSKPLEVFPTPNIIAWGKQVSEGLSAEAKRVRDAAARINARKLLVPDSLPVPQGTTEFTFRDVYNRYLTEFPSRVRAGQPPKAEDFEAAKKELWDTKYQTQVVYRGKDPEPVQLRQLQEDAQKEMVLVPDRVKAERAKSILFYMGPEAIARSPLVTNTTAGSSLAATAVWDAQLRIWVQNDILQAIVDLNMRESKTKSVVDAPVKYLLSTTIENIRGARAFVPGSISPMGGNAPDLSGLPPGMGSVVPGMSGPGGPGGPGMPSDMGGGPVADPMSVSVTGRTSTPLYDVVPFSIVVHVEAAKLPLFIEELGRNRFITVTQVSSLKAIDSVIYTYQYNVVYGSAPVAEVVISGEWLLLRDWSVKYMPREVRQSVGADVAENPVQ